MQGSDRAIYTLSVEKPQPHNTNQCKERSEKENVEDKKAASSKAKKKSLALLLKPACLTPSNVRPVRSFLRDTWRGIKLMRYSEVLQ